MARREAQELRELVDDELETRLAEAKQELFNLRFQLVTGQQENTARLRDMKHTVARIETILREREIAAAESVAAGADAGTSSGSEL
jgi:large subunit ribosomal protein L29